MEVINTKYPRTYHMPFSPGRTNDDKVLKDGWFDNYKGKEIVILEKLDGENTSITHFDCFARSHASPTRSPWSRNLWDKDGILWQVKDKISEYETVYGENLYGEHSIHYDKLTNYWHIFAVSDGECWYSWDYVCIIADILRQPHVPVLWRGVIESEEQLKTLVDKFVSEPSAYGDTREGVVVRIANEFSIDEFSKSVCKWVRPNHVQTDEHWTKHWKKANLILKSI